MRVMSGWKYFIYLLRVFADSLLPYVWVCSTYYFLYHVLAGWGHLLWEIFLSALYQAHVYRTAAPVHLRMYYNSMRIGWLEQSVWIKAHMRQFTRHCNTIWIGRFEQRVWVQGKMFPSLLNMPTPVIAVSAFRGDSFQENELFMLLLADWHVSRDLPHVFS